MHHALKIHEILTLILQLVPSEAKLRTAAAAARTCQTFYEPASDALWGELPAMRRLFDLLPRDLLARAGFQHDVARELGAHDWARFLQHSARVRSVTFEERDGGDALEDYSNTIVLMRRGSTGPILPKAHTLLIDGDFFLGARGYGVGNLSLFIGSEIREVRLGMRTGPRHHREIVEQLALLCPQLRHIELWKCEWREARLLLGFERLETVICSQDVTCRADLPTLAQLRSLRHLSVRLPSEIKELAGDQTARSAAIVRFPALETLELRDVGHSRFIKPVLRFIDSLRLQNVRFQAAYQPFHENPRAPGAVLTALASKFPNIRTLELVDWWSLAIFPQKAITTLHHLEELCLTRGNFTLTPQSVVALGKGCPKLRRLQVYSESRERDDFRSWSLHALELAATHLPKLEHLATSFDTSDVTELAEPHATSWVPLTLAVTKSPLRAEHVQPTASYISRVYPNVRFGLPKNYVVKEEDEDQRRWGQLAQAVQEVKCSN
ncbi:hypothetical protein PsYK624_052620 [Phanerochaete sordida]|uniref:F-box domain-containing protein n=1 Tax=Phanerochaete sordida TaxID=48140 RepID=A0A9P3G4T7_9APHY|nr:hypothetical protein PsYK624_052620 [Phanerochaete sordida]